MSLWYVGLWKCYFYNNNTWHEEEKIVASAWMARDNKQIGCPKRSQMALCANLGFGPLLNIWASRLGGRNVLPFSWQSNMNVYCIWVREMNGRVVSITLVHWVHQTKLEKLLFESDFLLLTCWSAGKVICCVIHCHMHHFFITFHDLWILYIYMTFGFYIWHLAIYCIYWGFVTEWYKSLKNPAKMSIKVNSLIIT